MDTTDDSSLIKRQEDFARSYNLTLPQYLQIVKSLTIEEVIIVLELCRSNSHRSSFRAAMHSKLKRWLDRGIVSKPFSERELRVLRPTWPVRDILLPK